MERVLYTKKGAPIREIDGNLFDKAGNQVGRFDGETVYGPDGRYAATLMADRLVYVPAYRGWLSYSFAPMRMAGTALGRMVPSAIAGEEPFTAARG